MSAHLNERAAAVAEWSVVATVSNNTACTATKAAVAGKRHYVTGISLSVGAAPAATVSATLKDGTTTIDQWEIPAAAIAPVLHTFKHPRMITAGALVEVSIPAVGGTTRATAVIHGFTRNA